MPDTDEAMLKVWDPLVRVSHWTLVVAFLVAYYTEGDALMALHAWAGYVVGVVIALRVLWGFVGPKHARFSDFVYKPKTSWAYAKALLRFRSERYIGHSPAGGAMILILLVGLAVTVWSGLETYAIKENAGPLASATAGAANTGKGGGLWSVVHENVGGFMMFLVVFHVAGALFASIAHRENLVRSMIDGKKPLR
ncbi:MAG: cytochrome b/b6 domain-containing protein [Paracoccaceae bacterium]